LVGKATAERDFAVGTIDQATYDATLAAIAATYTQSLDAAEFAYGHDEVIANGGRLIDIAVANDAYVVAAASATLAGPTVPPFACTISCPAFLPVDSWTERTEAAQRVYAIAEGTAARHRRVDVAALDAYYQRDEATQYRDAVGLLLPAATPWHQFEYDRAAGLATWATDITLPSIAHQAALADAELAEWSTIASAREVYFTDLAAAQRDRDVTKAGLAVTEAKIAAIKQAKGFVDGNYDPMRPLWPDPPEQYPYAIDAVFADPRPWTPPGRSDFVDPLGNLYQTQTWTERGKKFLPAKWNNPLQRDYLREGLVRPSTSWAGTIISGSDATTGQPLPQQQPNNNNDSGGTVPDPPSRVDLNTADAIAAFHDYYSRYADHGAVISDEATDVLTAFNIVGLADDHVFGSFDYGNYQVEQHFVINTTGDQQGGSNDDPDDFGDDGGTTFVVDTLQDSFIDIDDDHTGIPATIVLPQSTYFAIAQYWWTPEGENQSASCWA
jgi:hypothetical protein